jgi:cation diffusion facilitator CzcD-associated flavoprotein CzcO
MNPIIKSKEHIIANHDVIIIGSGFSGIGAGIRLTQEGINDFIILEKHQSLGGTWRDNTYPGCECDVPSALYSYSFAQNKNWSKVFAGQEEILTYTEKTARDFGILPFLRFGINVENMEWQEHEQVWLVFTEQGTYKANKVISCVGYLHEPILPRLAGLENFNGEVFHSSRWNHEIDLTGKRVAVIGTGASAIQFIPEIQPSVKKLVAFQRTPQWILPKPDLKVAALVRSVFHLPFTLKLFRKTLYLGMEAFGLGFRKPAILKRLQGLATWHINKHIKDEVLKKKITPDYTMGCKRVLLSNHYYKALAKDNVEVIASGVEQIKDNTIIATNGEQCEADVIILGTGFHVSDVPIAKHVRGKSGKTMNDIWQGSPEAYRGTTITDFPNFFLVLGPNLAIGHNSAFIIIEAQLNYVMGALTEMRDKKLSRLEVNSQAQKKYNEKVQQDLQTTVWNTGGCSSYYIDENGKNSIGFPWSTFKLRKMLAKFDGQAYSLDKKSEP